MITPVFPRWIVALAMLPALLSSVSSAQVAAPAAPAIAAATAASRTEPPQVPAVVAIARPTPAEVAQAAAALEKFLALADSATKAIVAKYPELLAVRPPRPNPLLVPGLAPGHRGKHAANVEVAQQGDIDVLFMGDSITDFWRRSGAPGVINPPSAGKAVFDRYFGGMKVANFGISGDTIQGVLYRLRNGEGQGFQPKAIMLMIGTNNAHSASSAEIAEGIGAVVTELRHHFPAAKILLLGIFPRANPGDALMKTVMGVNPIIAKLHDGEHVFYLDIGDKFLDAGGNIPADIMPDKLHPGEKGYEIWAEAVKEPLTALLQ